MNIDSFIQQAVSTGTFDSEGAFTISRIEAIRKLAVGQLPSPECWVLKLLQAAVRSGATRFTADRKKDVLYFDFSPELTVSADALAEALVRPDLSENDPVEVLAVGMRAVGFGENRSFTLAVEQGEEVEFLGWNGERLIRKSSPLSKHASRTHIRLAVAGAKDELAFLAARAEVCPVEVVVGNRRADAFDAPLTDAGHGLGKRVVMSAGWKPWKSDYGLPALVLPKAIGRLARPITLADRFTDDRVFCLSGPSDCDSVCYLAKISYGYHIDTHRNSVGKFRLNSKPRYCYVHWVKDGVICDVHRWKFEPWAAAFDLYLSAEGLPTDLSGLKVARRPDVAHRIKRALPLVSQQAGYTRRVLLEHFPYPFRYHSAVAGVLALVAFVSPPAFLLKVLTGGFAAVHLGYSVYDKRELMKDAAWHLGRLAEETLE